MDNKALSGTKDTFRLIAIILAFWPLLAAAAVLTFGECRGDWTEFLVYRGLGHLLLLFGFIIGAIASLKNHVQIAAQFKLSTWTTLLIIIFSFIFLYTSLFIAKFDVLLVRYGLPFILNAVLIIACTKVFVTWSKSDLEEIWSAIFASMLLYLPILPYIMFVLETESGVHWSSCFVPVQNVRWYGALVAIALAAGISTPWTSPLRNSPQSWWRPVGLFVLWTILFWSGSRGQVLGLVGALLILFTLSPRLRKRLFRQTIATALPGLVVSSLMPVPNGDFGFLQRIFFTKGIDQTTQVITSGRSAIWARTVEAIWERPILGYGPGQLFVATDEVFHHSLHTHNFPLEAILSFGFLGGGALLILILTFLVRQTVRARQKNFPDYSVAPFLMCTTILLMSLVSGGVFFLTISAYLVIAGVGLWISLAPIKYGN